MKTMKQRYLFLDVIRIFSILLIVMFHISQTNNSILSSFGFPGIPGMNAGEVGVLILIFVSGAALFISHPPKETSKNINNFYKGRLQRIYPAFWISMIIPTIISPTIISKINFINVIPLLSGFTAFCGVTSTWGGFINDSYWFIGLIVILYFFYPTIAKYIDNYPTPTMIILIFTTMISTLLSVIFDVAGAGTNISILFRSPLSNIVVFGAGMYIVRTGLYPKLINSNKIIIYLSELTFFVYLYHLPLLPISKVSIIIFIIVLTGICVVAKQIDFTIQKKITDLSNMHFNKR